MLLQVFLAIWLGAPIFGGAIMGIDCFFPNRLRLVRTVHSSICFFFACSLSLQVCNFTIILMLLAFPLYIEGVINGVKILGESSVDAINEMMLYEYVPFNFINAASWRLFSVTVIFCFFDRWSFLSVH
jgi:hypothetical protein